MQLFFITSALLLGATLINFPSALLPFWVVLLTLIVCLLFYHLLKKGVIIRISLWVIIGLMWAMIHAHWQLSWILPKGQQVKVLKAIGTITALPELADKSIKFDFYITDLYDEGQRSTPNNTVKLTWYGAYPELNVGEQWQLFVKLKRHRHYANPGSYDSSKRYITQGITATGYVVNRAANIKLSEANNTYIINQWRQRLQLKLKTVLKDAQNKGIINALLLGERGDISPLQWQRLQHTGTSHLMAISGLHVGMVATIFFFCIKLLGSQSATVISVVAPLRIASVGAIIAAFFYSALAGFSIPTQRALIMVFVMLGAKATLLNISTFQAFQIALLMILIINPLATMTIGFWLSFSAVAIILWGIVGRNIFTKGPKQWLYMQGLITLGLLPLTLLFFQQASLVSPLANLIAIPWVGFSILPMSLIAILLLLFDFPGYEWLFMVVDKQLMALLWFLESLSEYRFSSVYLSIQNPWVLFCAVLGVFAILLPRGLPFRLVGVVGLLPLFFYQPEKPKQGELWFTLLDVGQGLSAVIQTENHVLIYDTGPKYGEYYDLGRVVVLPYLRKAGIRNIDVLVISHGHNDHSGGALSITQQLSVEKILTSEPNYVDVNPVELCQEASPWQWDGVEFEVLHPKHTLYSSRNNNSCVLKVTLGDNTLLLPGDIEYQVEQELVNASADKLSADIVIVPHHGSKTSSTTLFVDTVKPDYALISSGYLNRYQFPHASVLENYMATDSQLLCTSRHGAITFKLDGNEITPPNLYRQSIYWWWL